MIEKICSVKNFESFLEIGQMGGLVQIRIWKNFNLKRGGMRSAEGQLHFLSGKYFIHGVYENGWKN